MKNNERRQRLHELLIALIHQQKKLELLDHETPSIDSARDSSKDYDPASWLDRNRRILKSYQALIRSAVTLDALMDTEEQSYKSS